MKKIGSRPKEPSGSRPRANREQILYIEDDDDNFRVAELRLGDAYDLVRAKSSREACAALREHASTLSAILVDVELRGSELDGVEIVEIIRGKAGRNVPDYARDLPILRVPILFVTAHGARLSEAILLRAGADRVITKPVDFGELNLALTRLHLSRTLKRPDRA